MNELATKILAAQAIATKAMEDAIADYRKQVKANPAALAQAIRVCGSEGNIEPLYCGFASVIIPAELNPGFNKAVKEAYASFGFKLDAAGNVMTASGEFARDVPAHVRDLGSRCGYTTKGRNTKSDWEFHGPGTYRGQSMDIKEIGARAFADALMADSTVVGARVFTRGD